MRNWSPTIDPATIPTEIIREQYEARVLPETMRQRQAARKTFGAGTGRPRKMVACQRCSVSGGTAEMRRHKCG